MKIVWIKCHTCKQWFRRHKNWCPHYIDYTKKQNVVDKKEI